MFFDLSWAGLHLLIDPLVGKHNRGVVWTPRRRREDENVKKSCRPVETGGVSQRAGANAVSMRADAAMGRRTAEGRQHNLLHRPRVSVQPSGGTASHCSSVEQLLSQCLVSGVNSPPVLFGLFPASTYLFSWRHTVIITPGTSIKQLDTCTRKESHSDPWLLIEPPRLYERLWTLYVETCTPLCVINWLRAYKGPREHGAALHCVLCCGRGSFTSQMREILV